MEKTSVNSKAIHIIKNPEQKCEAASKKIIKQKISLRFYRNWAFSFLLMEESHGINGVDDSYRHLPVLYLTFLSIWSLSACSWTVNTFKNRHFQVNIPQISVLILIKVWIFLSWVDEVSSQFQISYDSRLKLPSLLTCR